MEISLPKLPKDSGFVEEIPLNGVTKINTAGVKFIISNKVVAGLEDKLILKSFHIADPEFIKKIAAGGFVIGKIPGEIAWEITRQVGIGAEVVNTSAPAPMGTSLSMAAPRAAVSRSARSTKRAAKSKRTTKKKSRKTR
jgi:hypothetical protein